MQKEPVVGVPTSPWVPVSAVFMCRNQVEYLLDSDSVHSPCLISLCSTRCVTFSWVSIWLSGYALDWPVGCFMGGEKSVNKYSLDLCIHWGFMHLYMSLGVDGHAMQ